MKMDARLRKSKLEILGNRDVRREPNDSSGVDGEWAVEDPPSGLFRDAPRIANLQSGKYSERVIFQKMQLWIDPVERTGPEAMAVDEWLLETLELPVLRVYRWLGEWGSIGYFGSVADARAAFPGLDWVRRWTGGGTVDHRADWTYSVVAPAGGLWAGGRGAESYRLVHAALVEVLAAEGIEARLSEGTEETAAALCFENPVGHDLIDSAGRKLAGAGQRRTRRGLLHQGSVAAACESAVSAARAARLVALLTGNGQPCDFVPPEDRILRKVAERYALSNWTDRR